MVAGIFKSPTEIAIPESFIEDVLEMRLRGESYAKIASKLNRRGIRSKTGGRWYGASLNRYMQIRCCELLQQFTTLDEERH